MSTFFLFSFAAFAIDVITLAFNVVHCTILSFRLDLVLLSLARIVSPSTHYHLNCHRIETCDTACIRISCEPSTSTSTWMGMVLYCQDIFLWPSIECKTFEIMISFIDAECYVNAIHTIEEILYMCCWIFSPGHFYFIFFSSKNVCKFSTMHFSWTLNGFHDFETTVKKKIERKKWTKWRSILFYVY